MDQSNIAIILACPDEGNIQLNKMKRLTNRLMPNHSALAVASIARQINKRRLGTIQKNRRARRLPSDVFRRDDDFPVRCIPSPVLEDSLEEKQRTVDRAPT